MIAMKIAFVVYNDLLDGRVLQLLGASGIDYYTRWERTTGKGAERSRILGRAVSAAPTRS